MGEKWKYYDVEDYKSWKRKQGKEYRSPPRENYLAAAIYIRNLFDGKKFNWAAVGSLAMLCLGSRREMSDIHIVYDDQDYKRIKSKLESDDRVRLPKGINSLFPIKILIKTGPHFKDSGCTTTADVELDLLPPGSHGTPIHEVLRKNQVLLRLNGSDGKLNSFRGVNLLYLVNVSLHFSKSQDLVWDPLQDIVFLCQHYGKDIEPVRGQLSPKILHDNFFSSPVFARLPLEAQRTCSMTLLGQEFRISSPPALAVTPPPRTNTRGPVMSNDGPDARAATQSRISGPTLKSGIQSSHVHTDASIHTGSKAPPGHSAALGNNQPRNGTGPRAQAVPVYSAGVVSQSRYRPTSAPNTSGQSRNPSLGPPVAQPVSTRPRSMDSRSQGDTALQTPATQHSRKLTNPQVVSSHASAREPATRNSLPEVRDTNPRGRAAAYTQNVAPQASAVVPPVPLIPQGFGSAAYAVSGQSRIRHSSLPPSQQGRGGNRLNPPGATSLNHTRQFEHNGIMRNASPPARQNATPLAEIDATSRSAEVPTHSAGLRLVGPEGLYGAPAKCAYSGIASDQKSGFHGPSAHIFAAELPATAPTPKPRSDSPQELPNRSLPPSQRTSPLQHSHNLHGQHAFISELPADSVIPPQPLTAPLHPLSKQLELPTRPSHPRTILEPFTGLPPSLIVGGSKRSPNSTPPFRSPQQLPSQPAIPAPSTENRSAYGSRYYAHDGPISPPSTSSPYMAYTATTSTFPSAPEPLARQHEPPPEFHTTHQPPALQPHSEPSDHHRNSNPTVQADILPSQRMQPKRLTTGYEQFAHGPYTPVDSDKSASAKTDKGEDLYGYYYRHDNEFASGHGPGTAGRTGHGFAARDSSDVDARSDPNRESVYSVYDEESDGGERFEEVEVPLPLQPRRQRTGF